MKKIKILTIILLCTTISLSLLAGKMNNDNDIESEKASNDKNVEITWWAFPNFKTKDGVVGEYEENIVDAFMDKNPNIKVNVEMLSFEDGEEKINSAILSNSTPDVLYDAPGRIINYAKKDLLVPIDSMIEAFKGDVSGHILQGCRLDDTYYMYPFNTTNFMMAANKDMFEDEGLLNLLPLNKEDRQWSIEELEKALRAIKEARPDVIPLTFYSEGTAGDQGTRAFIANIFGGSVMDEDQKNYTFDSPEMIKAMEWVRKAIDEGLIAEGTENLTTLDAVDLYLQQKAAITILYSTGLATSEQSKKSIPFTDLLLPIPSPEGELNLESLIAGFAIFNNKDEDKIEASKKFIDFLCNDEDWQEKNLEATGTFSVRDSVKGIYDDEEMRFAEGMEKYKVKYYNNIDGFAEMRTYWIKALQEITRGERQPEEVLEEFNIKANETLKK